jgi:hypothetical protein
MEISVSVIPVYGMWVLSTTTPCFAVPFASTNVMINLRRQQKALTIQSDAIEEVLYLVWKLFPDVGVQGNQLIRHGVALPALVRAIEHQLELEELPFKVDASSVYAGTSPMDPFTTYGALREAAFSNRSSIILFGKYPKADPDSYQVADRLGGHYMVALGHDLGNRNIFYFLDPSHPEKPRPALVDLVQLPGENQLTQRVRFQDEIGQKSALLLIEGVIKITRVHPEI